MRTSAGHTRRHFLAASAGGIGSLAAAWLWHQDHAHAAPPRPDLKPPTYDLTAKQPPRPARAQAMISLWMQGGPSHIDLFDPKPALARLAGKPFPGEIKYDNAAQASSKVLPCPWKFARRGQSGMELSELLPHLGTIADDICLVRSMHTGVNNHGQSIRALHTGGILEGHPSLGSWLTFALGSPSQDLPAYCAMIDPGQLPVLGVENWSQGWLPALFQGTVIRPQEPRILNLAPATQFAGKPQTRYLDYLQRLNQRHLERYPGELELEARLSSYALAARMQGAAREALDLSRETQATKRRYGMEDQATADFGARCLIARRLVERGVRFVQVFTQNQFWDHHNRIRKSLPAACLKIDQPSAALVRDLKERGLLDTTLVHWGGEMGRLPVIQNDTGADKIGRDHNTYGFSMWLAGGGVRGGKVHGATDEFGHRAVENVVHHYDFHATALHLFGLNPEHLVYKDNGRERSFFNLDRGRVVRDILT